MKMSSGKPYMPSLFTVMTYNVHSCIGSDGLSSPLRIASVIAEREPDIVALQELDRGLERSGLSDQTGAIADDLMMQYHFHPSLEIGEGHYGNAILSRFPLRVIKGAELPTLPGRSDLEKRGALWVEVMIGEERVQVINTHLGLRHQERLAQAEMLLSSEWLQHPDCRDPVILCGDLNVFPVSSVYKWLTGRLRDTQRRWRAERTFPSVFPLFRLDYIMISQEINVKQTTVIRDPLARIASDHLPLTAVLELR
jgi:endonuclease/exonuclease/phosphatase family metal-dependent hydrolase